MKPRRVVLLVAGALLGGGLTLASAQDTTPAQAPQDTSVQGYAPAAPAPAAEPAPAAAPAPAPAAAPAAAPRAPNRAEALRSLGFVEVLPARPLDRIQRELGQAELDQREAEADLAAKQQEEEQVKAMVEVKKQEISTLNARRKLAEKSKQEAESASFEAEKKGAERHKQFLERRVSLHQAERDMAKAEKSFAEATHKALEIELELSRRRTERTQLGNTDPAAAMRQDNVIRELERKVLEAQRAAAEREKQVAAKHADIARRRLDLYQAQAAAAGNS